MNLPKIQTPIYKTKLISNETEVTFRPFLVKEEKILLTAIKTEDQNIAIENFIQILKNCIITKLDIENLPSFDSIHLFVELRKKSMGEIINISVKDGEENKYFDAEMDLNKIKIIKNETSNNIKLNDEIGIILKYPTIRDVSNIILDNKTEFTVENLLEFLTKTIEKIYDKENVYECKNYKKEELIKFLEGLTSEMFEKISAFFNNIPKLIYEDTYISPYNKKEIKVSMDNIMDFLL